MINLLVKANFAVKLSLTEADIQRDRKAHAPSGKILV